MAFRFDLPDPGSDDRQVETISTPAGRKCKQPGRNVHAFDVVGTEDLDVATMICACRANAVYSGRLGEIIMLQLAS